MKIHGTLCMVRRGIQVMSLFVCLCMLTSCRSTNTDTCVHAPCLPSTVMGVWEELSRGQGACIGFPGGSQTLGFCFILFFL